MEELKKISKIEWKKRNFFTLHCSLKPIPGHKSINFHKHGNFILQNLLCRYVASRREIILK